MNETYRAHLTAMIAGPASVRSPHGVVTTTLHDAGLLHVPGGGLCIDDVSEIRFRLLKPPLDRPVPAGRFLVKLVVARGPAAAQVGDRPISGEFTALCYVGFTEQAGREARFVAARYAAPAAVSDPEFHLVQADGGFCALYPAGLDQAALQQAGQICLATLDPAHPLHRRKAFVSGNKVIAMRAGLGPGAYPIWWGLDPAGNVVSVVIDFQVVGTRPGGDARSGYTPYPPGDSAAK